MTEQQSDLSASTPVVKWSEQWWAAAKTETQARRCRAHRKNGDRCKRLALVSQRVCSHHGGKAAHSLAAARRRLAENADPAVRQLAKIAYDADVAVETRLKATLALIDRSVGGAKTSVEVEVSAKPFEQIEDAIVGQLEITSRADWRKAHGIEDDGGDVDPLAQLQAQDLAHATRDDSGYLDVLVVDDTDSGGQAHPSTRVRRDWPASEPTAGEVTPSRPGGLTLAEAAEQVQHLNRYNAQRRGGREPAKIHTPQRALPPGRSP